MKEAKREENAGMTRRQATTELKCTSVLFVIFLMIITAGIYIPIWFLTRRKVINNLQSSQKLGFDGIVLALVLISISLLVDVIGGIENISGLLSMVALIIIIFQSFKVRSILEDHFVGSQFSGVLTFLATICYLQYKINGILGEKAN